MDNAALACVVMGYSVIFVGEVFAAALSGGSNGRLALAAGDDFDTAMEIAMRCAPFCGRCPLFSFVPTGTKRRLQDRTYHSHVVYKCALAKCKGMGLVPYPCAVASILVSSIIFIAFRFRIFELVDLFTFLW